MAEKDPFTEDDFERLFAAAEASENDEWTLSKKTPAVEVWKRKENSETIRQVKGKMLFKGIPMQAVYEMLNVRDVRLAWDERIIVFDELESNGELSVLHTVLKLPGPINNRDFVSNRKIRKEPKQIMVLMKPTTHPSAPITPNFIRGEMNSGFIFRVDEEDADSTRATFVNKLDLKGSIPKMVINLISGKAAVGMHDSITKFYAKDYSKREKLETE